MPLPRLYNIGYFLMYREYVLGITTEDVTKARTRAAVTLDNMLQSSETDDETGLPAGLAAFGVRPADAM